MLGHTFKPSTWEAEAGRAEFKASLIYIARSSLVRASSKILS